MSMYDNNLFTNEIIGLALKLKLNAEKYEILQLRKTVIKRRTKNKLCLRRMHKVMKRRLLSILFYALFEGIHYNWNG